MKTVKYPLFLAMTVLASLLSGCGSDSTSAGAEVPAPSTQVIIYHAGSLSAAFNNMTGPYRRLTGIQVIHKAYGSVEAAKRVTVGKEPADIYGSADYTNIDAFLKPTYADYTIQFAQGQMVLAYTTKSAGASLIDPTASAPPYATLAAVPTAAADWYTTLIANNAKIGGADPNADPGGYRAFMIMQLASIYYSDTTIYDKLVKNQMITGSADKIGTTFDYTFTYEHSAQAAAKADATYRYVHLPDDINLSNSAKAAYYRQAVINVAGLTATSPAVPIQGTRVTWGLTVLKTAPHPDAALSFLQFMFSPQGIALQKAVGPDPIGLTGPAVTTLDDYLKLPTALQPLVGLRP
jgi:molybdate/tungstate transport system substrate-binding protein